MTKLNNVSDREGSEEFDRPVPEEYALLIQRSLNREDPIFFNIDQQLAPSIIGRIDKDSDIKNKFSAVVRGKDFIDLGCGEPEVHWEVEDLMPYRSVAEFARFLGAARYIGVDICAQSAAPVDGKFPRIYKEGEVLEFLSQIPDADKHPSGKFFFISGLESTFGETAVDRMIEQGKFVVPDRSVMARYHQALYDELARVTKVGDGVYLGPRTKSFRPLELIKRGFKSNLGLKYDARSGNSEGINRLDILIRE